MIKKLRRRFLAIAMLSTTLVLFVIVGGINVANYHHIKQSMAHERHMMEDKGDFPKGFDDRPGRPPRDDMPFMGDEDAMSYAMDVYENGKMAAFRNFLFLSIGISLAGLLGVYILLRIFVGVILRPVEESYAKQKRFITDASHELKTPLTVIDANTEILEMTGGENEWTESIKKQTKRLAKLTESLVLLTRMDEEQKMIDRIDFDLSQTVGDLAESYRAVAVSKGYQFDTDIEENIHYEGDEGRIGQVLGILLDNAMKYTSASGSILVSLKQEGSKKQLIVWNTVDEIEKGKIDQLFDRFYRMDQSRNTGTGGFGIGLSVARAIVEAHKGSIHARSVDGKSIEFCLTL